MKPSQIVMHVRMLDEDAKLQQEALGIVGVNLMHAAFFEHHEPDEVIQSLLDRLTTGRIEIDMIEFRGYRIPPGRQPFDGTQAGAARPERRGHVRTGWFAVLQPSEALAQTRDFSSSAAASGRPTVVNINMLECALEKFEKDPAVVGKPVLALTELTMRNLLAGGADMSTVARLPRAGQTCWPPAA